MMKYKSYEKMYQKDIWEIKEFLLRFAAYYQIDDLKDRLYLARDLPEIKKIIGHYPQQVQRRLFSFIKAFFEANQDLEQQLIYMHLLLNWKDPIYSAYRIKMKQRLESFQTTYLTTDLYVLMRHLLPNFTKVKTYYLSSLKENDEIQNYFLCEIYLVEEDYQMAYTYLKGCRYEGALKQYDASLKAYSPLKYRLYAQKRPFFNQEKWSEYLWMKKPLKFWKLS